MADLLRRMLAWLALALLTWVFGALTLYREVIAPRLEATTRASVDIVVSDYGPYVLAIVVLIGFLHSYHRARVSASREPSPKGVTLRPIEGGGYDLDFRGNPSPRMLESWQRFIPNHSQGQIGDATSFPGGSSRVDSTYVQPDGEGDR